MDRSQGWINMGSNEICIASLLDLELDPELDWELIDYGEEFWSLWETLPTWATRTYLQMPQKQRESDIAKPKCKREEEWEKEKEDRRRREQRTRKLVKLLIKALLYLQRCQQVLLSVLIDTSATPPVWKKRLKSISICMPWCIPPALIILWSVVWMFRPGANDQNEWYHEHAETVDPAALTTTQPASASVDWLVAPYLPDYQPPYDHAPISGGAIATLDIPELFGFGEAPGDLLSPSNFNPDFLAPSIPLFDLPALLPDPVPWTDSFLFPDAASLLVNEAASLPRTALANPNALHTLIETPLTTALSISPAGPALLPRPRVDAHTAQPDEPPRPNGQAKKQRRTKTQACTQCNMSFISRRDLRRHTIGTHDRAKPYLCNEPGCDHRTSREDNVRRHKRLVHGIGKDGTAPRSTSSRGKRSDDEGAAGGAWLGSSSSKRLTPGEMERRLRETEIQLQSERERRRQLEDQLRRRDQETRAAS